MANTFTLETLLDIHRMLVWNKHRTSRFGINDASEQDLFRARVSAVCASC